MEPESWYQIDVRPGDVPTTIDGRDPAPSGRTIYVMYSTGSGNISEVISSNGTPFIPVFVRCHFTGVAGLANLTVSVDSGMGSVHDTTLYTDQSVGVDADCHLKFTDNETSWPSPFSLSANDKLKVEWGNPNSGNITWGLAIGIMTGAVLNARQ